MYGNRTRQLAFPVEGLKATCYQSIPRRLRETLTKKDPGATILAVFNVRHQTFAEGKILDTGLEPVIFTLKG